MTMFSPNLQVKRLVVSKSAAAAYDETFHSGLNIIRGENSSGKSTIMDFIFYALGGDLSEWRETALLCDTVYLTVSLNGKVATLARDVSSQQSRPMRIFLGDYEKARASAPEAWEVYPYRRGEKDSFSQVLFRYLGLPEVSYGEADTKITMNQLLRLLYADQLSPVNRLFRFQRFDDAITRQTVGDLLCGAFSSRFYEAKLRIITVDSLLKDLEGKITFLISSHSGDGHPLTSEWLSAQRAEYQRELDATTEQIGEIEDQIFRTQFDDRLTLNDQERTYSEVVRLQGEIARLTEQVDQLKLEISDSVEFLLAVEAKLAQLNEADAVIEQLKQIEYEVCPACLTPIDKHSSDGACTLCKAPFDPEEIRSRSLKLINEFARQKDQSIHLQEGREAKLLQLNEELTKATELWQQAERHYRIAVRSPTTELRSKLRTLNRRAGYLVRQLEDLARTAGIIQQLADLSGSSAKLREEQKALSEFIVVEAERNARRVSQARQEIEAKVKEFLHRDLARQSTFTGASDVLFEFDADRISVNGDSYFSASSMVYLKNSFFASFALTAADDRELNHPRFLLMDTVEDKGMEQARSQNFQMLLAAFSASAGSDHQIIIATSMIAPDLNNDAFTIGDYYTHDRRTLRISG